MALKAGTVDSFADSMAAAIEAAFEAEWSSHMRTVLPTTGRTERRILFAAIAQGVVRHLKERASAFEVAVDVRQTTAGGEPLIESRNPDPIPLTASYSISSGAAKVTQDAGASNLIRSVGKGDVTIVTE